MVSLICCCCCPESKIEKIVYTIAGLQYLSLEKYLELQYLIYKTDRSSFLSYDDWLSESYSSNPDFFTDYQSMPDAVFDDCHGGYAFKIEDFPCHISNVSRTAHWAYASYTFFLKDGTTKLFYSYNQLHDLVQPRPYYAISYIDLPDNIKNQFSDYINA